MGPLFRCSKTGESSPFKSNPTESIRWSSSSSPVSPQPSRQHHAIVTWDKESIDHNSEATRAYHEHFGFNSQADVVGVACTLQGNASNSTTAVFLDRYFDSAELILTASNTWLRCRDGLWQLSYTDAPLAIPLLVQYVHAADDIVNFITNRCKEIKWMDAPSPEAKLEQTFTRGLALLPTLRTTYLLNGTTVARIDTFKAGNSFWTIGSISASEANETEQILNKLALKDKIALHALGKLFTALKASGETQVCDVLSNCLQAEAKANASNFQGLEHSDYPYEKFDDACSMALIAQIPLAVAFSQIWELEDIV